MTAGFSARRGAGAGPERPSTRSDIAFATRARAGEVHNGDRAVVVSDERGDLFAVIDGLGHGQKAAEAARVAAGVVAGADPRGDLVELMNHVHLELRGTRGVAMSVVAISGGELRAGGVGNVCLRSSGIQLSFASIPGVLGGRIRSLRATTQPICNAARIWLYSDGISTHFDPAAYAEHSPARACECVLGAHWKSHDDGTVLVCDIDT